MEIIYKNATFQNFISPHCVQPQPRAVIKLCGDGTNVPYYPTPHTIEGAISDFFGFEETLHICRNS